MGHNLKGRELKKITKPGRYGDGRGSYGLALDVRPRADGGVRKSWVQRVRIGGRPTYLGLGPYPLVTLTEARKKALKNRRDIEAGIDPRGGDCVPTFAEATEKVIASYASGWKPGSSTEKSWRSTLGNHALPVFGNKPVDQITTADILTCLTPIWGTKPATARFVKQRISAVMRWCIAQGHRADNPSGETLSAALPKQNRPTEHHRALPHAEVRDAISQIRHIGAPNPVTALTLEFQILTATRPTEARLARWSEISQQTATWTIPPERMKRSLEHRVPLSTSAFTVLNQASILPGGRTGLVFPSRDGRSLAPGTIGALLRRTGIDAVPHGFRSSFRVWAEECTDTPRSVTEAALAHTNPNKVEAAYLRSDLFERRRVLMQAWANYLHR